MDPSLQVEILKNFSLNNQKSSFKLENNKIGNIKEESSIMGNENLLNQLMAPKTLHQYKIIAESFRHHRKTILKHPELLKGNVRKRLRESGNEYVSTSNKTVPKKCLKSPRNNCLLNCNNVFSNDARMHIQQSFLNMYDDEKNQFYLKFVTRHPVERHRTVSVRLIYKIMTKLYL